MGTSLSFPCATPRATDFPQFPAFDGPGELCRDLFVSLPRSDQRRWGEVYVRGLATVPGRKSIRRIAENVVGWRADQCLQQFVNQSPWAWAPVRRRLAQFVDAAVRPQAWVVTEAVFPKHGNNSVGVAKQYAPSVGAMLNCQLGLALFMAGESGSCPVEWRLLMPSSWERDAGRRHRTHVPDQEHHRSRWQHVLDMADELTAEWDLPARPLIVEAQREPQVEPLLAGLEERGLRYLVQVAPGTLISPNRSVTVAEAVAHALRPGRSSLRVQASAASRVNGSQFVAISLYGVVSQFELGAGRAHAGLRRIVARVPARRQSVGAVWLTNLTASHLPDLIDLTALGHRTGRDLKRMNDESGLRHFEGRSFRGWHHHVTLASVAHASRLLTELAADDCDADPTARPAAG